MKPKQLFTLVAACLWLAPGGLLLQAREPARNLEDLAKLAAAQGIPIKEVQALAQKAWLER